MFFCTSDLDVEGSSNISRNRSNTVPEGNGPVPHHDEFGSGKLTMMADLYRMMEETFDRQPNQTKSNFDRQDKTLGEFTKKMRVINQCLADLQHQAQYPRLATEADIEPEMKTCKRTEGAAADRVNNGNNSSTRVDSSIAFFLESR